MPKAGSRRLRGVGPTVILVANSEERPIGPGPGRVGRTEEEKDEVQDPAHLRRRLAPGACVGHGRRGGETVRREEGVALLPCEPAVQVEGERRVALGGRERLRAGRAAGRPGPVAVQQSRRQPGPGKSQRRGPTGPWSYLPGAKRYSAGPPWSCSRPCSRSDA